MMLLSQGECVYHGPASDALEHFENIGNDTTCIFYIAMHPDYSFHNISIQQNVTMYIHQPVWQEYRI